MSSRKDLFKEDSLCVTEENRYENVMNPIKLAELDWQDEYKREKLTKNQIQLVAEGKFDPEAYFGGIDADLLFEVFEGMGGDKGNEDNLLEPELIEQIN